MNKTEFIDFIASEHCVTRYDAKRAVTMVTDCITKIVGDGNSVELVGFGSFFMRRSAERQGLNPRTREKITIAEYNKPVFKASKNFKRACN